MKQLNCIVMGAAGRDFHDLLTFFADHPGFRVRCFTAQQIPFIDARSFPRELAPEGYDEDIPIHPERELEELITRYEADFVFLSLSDLAHSDVMHLASRVHTAGASFCLLGPRHTQLTSRLPVISVTGVRTGCGKSPLSQLIAVHLTTHDKRVGVIRHPMPYGDLRKQRLQHFRERADLDRHDCTVEEREEYEPYLTLGLSIYAGVDYKAILAEAEQHSDIILWDGGNNDTPFIEPGLSIVVADALREGHEISYHPGETNLRGADVVVINKVDQAPPGAVERIRAHVIEYAPKAVIIEGALDVDDSACAVAANRRALVLEDGPTITHGGMPSGAGLVAAQRCGALVVDPRKFAVGSLARALADYPHIGPVLPALGYSEQQCAELSATIAAAAPDVIIDASPASLEHALKLDIPIARIRYGFRQVAGMNLLGIIDNFVDAAGDS